MSRSIIDTYVQEASEILDGLEGMLLELEHSAEAERVDAVFRGLHTVKGSGSMFGFGALARFTHHFESAFEKVRDGTLSVDRRLIDLALEARDRMASFLALGGDGPEAEELESDPSTLVIIERLAALTGETVSAAAPSCTVGSVAQNSANRSFEILFQPELEAIRNGMKPELLLAELGELGRVETVMLAQQVPTLSELVPDESWLGYRIRLETSAGRDAIDDVFIFASDAKLSIKVLEAPEATQPEEPSSAGTNAPADVSTVARPVGTGSSKEAGSTSAVRPSGQGADHIRVPAKRLDEMMDQLGELVIAQARLQRIAERVEDAGLEAIVEEMQRLVTSLRDSTLSIRMLPIEMVFDKFRRVVRTLSADLGKEVELVVVGGETEVDKNVIDSLSEPLVHMIRNSMDHGLESAAERLAAGKSPRGCLRLSAAQEGGEVLISVEDDGRGLNTEAIRRRAMERGLIAADAQLSDAELNRLIFEPGFSTAQTISSVSGRGVGMDAVKRAIEALRGSIDVSTQPGKGSRITLRLPVTLAIIDGLLVRVGRAIYALPLANVNECVELSAASLHHESGRSMLRIRDAMVPFLDLGQHFRQESEQGAVRRIVIVHAEGRRIGLMVDDILGQNQTVIKTLSPFHRDIGIFSGATILGDGRVALIIDVTSLLKNALAAGGGTSPNSFQRFAVA